MAIPIRPTTTSRLTANKAIRDLAQGGWLIRQPGLGTFVTDRKAQSSLHDVLNLAAAVCGRGNVYNNDVLRRETAEADDAVALRLGVRLGTRAFHTIPARRKNDVPI